MRVKDRGLGIALFVLFFVSWALQLATHDFPTEGWAGFWNASAENWQSEFLQLLTFVVLSKHLIYKDSPQSRDGDDRLHKKVDTILRRV